MAKDFGNTTMNDLTQQTDQIVTALTSLHDDMCWVLIVGFISTGLIVVVMSVCNHGGY